MSSLAVQNCYSDAVEGIRRLGLMVERVIATCFRLKRWAALAYIILSPAAAIGEDSRQDIPIPYGSSIKSDQVTVGTFKSLESKLRHAVPDFYSREELTFAPEIWKMAAIHAMADGVDWTVNANSKSGDFCPKFLTDLQTWNNVDIVEPIARANSFGHENFRPIRQACPRLEPHAVVYYVGKERLAGYALRAFKWFRFAGSNGETTDLLVSEDAASKGFPAEIDGLGNRLSGPILDGGTIASGMGAALFDLEGCSSTRLAFPPRLGRSFSYYFQDIYSTNYPGSSYHASEFLAVQYLERAYLLFIDVFAPSKADPGPSVKNARRLRLVGVSDGSQSDGRQTRAVVAPGFQRLPTICSFDAAAGDIERLRKGGS